MSWLKISILALVQGFAELLPVSSSAHVILTEKLMGLDPTLPQMTLLLVLLHTGTMGSVLVYFWPSWKTHYFQSKSQSFPFLVQVAIATFGTGLTGLFLMEFLKKVFKIQVEDLFGNLTLIAVSLALAGGLILLADDSQKPKRKVPLGNRPSFVIGLVQGICLPFRGFSRSGATISTGLLLGLPRLAAEEFSFALAVVLTPPVIAREFLRLYRAQGLAGLSLGNLAPDLLGLVLSFLAGLWALRWLTRWLEGGRWKFFGFYCLGASLLVFLFRFAAP